jgi:hypothetical protein
MQSGSRQRTRNQTLYTRLGCHGCIAFFNLLCDIGFRPVLDLEIGAENTGGEVHVDFDAV